MPHRWVRPLILAPLIGLLVAELAIQLQGVAAEGKVGMDFGFYREVGSRWLTSGELYLPHQLAGPYDVALMVDVLYPPPVLLLLVPLALAPSWAAALLWWGVPAVTMTIALRRWRPSDWGLIGAVILLLWPRAVGAIVFGNSDVWVATGIAAGLVWGWPGAAVLLKPTFAPIFLLFVRDRRAWIGLVALAGVSVLMAGLWIDYLTAMRNVHIGWDYSIGSVPLALVPVIAWSARQRQTTQPAGLTKDSVIIL